MAGHSSNDGEYRGDAEHSAVKRLLAAAATAHQDGRMAEAKKTYMEVLQRSPEHKDALHLLGLVLYQEGDLKGAATLIDRAIQRDAGQVGFWCNRGVVHQAEKQYAEAEACFRHARQLDSGHVDTLLNLGSILEQTNRPKEAEDCYRLALEINDPNPVAHFMLAGLLANTGRNQEAERSYREAIKRNPGYFEAYNNLGGLLASDKRPEEAEQSYRVALRLKPDSPEANYNLATTLQVKGEIQEAADAYRRVLELNPGQVGAHYNLGEALLLLGQLPEGWVEYEYRSQTRDRVRVRRPALSFPEWQGENLAGMRLLLVGEQGIGDQIQFVRFAEILRGMGAVVDVVANPLLADLLSTVPGVNEVYSQFLDTKYNFWSFMMSVPRWLGTDMGSIPSQVPYVHADDASVRNWGVKLGKSAGRGKKVGVVWAGNPEHANDEYRSMRIEELSPLQEIPGISWFSLQKERADSRLTGTGGALSLHLLGDQLQSFSDTAAVISNLDLVITVDTAVAHLAGALAKPTWVLLPANPDWRWLLGREDSPWYPTIRLFRQQSLGNWSEVITRVAKALEKFT